MSPADAVGDALHRTFLANWYQLPGWLALAAALLGAWRWGGWAERWIGAWLLADYVVHSLVGATARALLEQAAPVSWSLAADLVFAPAYLWAVIRSEKAWPLFFAAFWFLMAASRLVRIVVPEVGAWAGVTAVVIWTFLAQLAFTIGVVRCALERRKRGPPPPSR
jgi:hypothetical protein